MHFLFGKNEYFILLLVFKIISCNQTKIVEIIYIKCVGGIMNMI